MDVFVMVTSVNTSRHSL